MMNVFQNRPFNLTNGVMSCICPQNGVLEGGPLCRVETPLTMPASLDSHSGNVSSNGGQSRPKILDVNPAKGYKPKHVFDSGDTDEQEGSLPCTPELESDTELDVSPAGNEALDNETTQLISSFLRHYTGLSTRRWNQKNEPLATMKRVVDGLLEKHRYAYNGMITKLSLDDRGDDASFVSAVAKSLFGDGTTNWGRVVSLVAFGAVVSQYLKEKSRENCVEQVAKEISTYLLTEQRDWLVKNNSWDGFVEFFRVADPESTVRNTLMAFAGFAGIGATLALLIR
ncbi:induced myeloid leukemia cell differentiation protein Mcl-1b [Larimichthys crocea]|uniref:induced myeloid leukemia cell differentiation protein Mcl-1b n=1 Tax=Larimichthys crocea TaxID=215358 RepID=UPI00054B9FCB|nr:induced myeloid leukemia cell differentiation protein Mcl-1 [Larimichthys crocea]